MTPTRYALARFAQAFGYNRKNRRMSDAASEMHLLREAETNLGMLIWEKIEHIEPLSVEYWNLRKRAKEKETLSASIAKCREQLDKAHEERANLLNSNAENPEQQALLEQRSEHLRHLENCTRRRDLVIESAREIRRSYTGMQMKLEVLSKNPEQKDAAEGLKEKLAELKTKFDALKQERIDIGHEIEEGDQKIDDLDEKIQNLHSSKREQASEAFQTISQRNKEISNLRAELSLIDTHMRQLYSDIGRHVSRNFTNDDQCAEAAEQYKGLIHVMKALRRSVALNNTLAGNV